MTATAVELPPQVRHLLACGASQPLPCQAGTLHSCSRCVDLEDSRRRQSSPIRLATGAG